MHQLYLVAGLLAALTLAFAGSRPARVAAAAVLMGNFAVNTAFCLAFVGSNDPQPWPMFMVADYLSGLMLFVFAKGRLGRVLIATFAIQMIAHCAYAIMVGPRWVDARYWWALYEIAWAQILITGGWIVADMARDRSRALRSEASHQYGHATKEEA